MPNHTTNIVTIKGKKADKEALKEFVRGEFIDDDGGQVVKTVNPFSLNSICPMPEELKGVGSPASIVSENEYLEWKNGKKDMYICGGPITEKMHKEFIDKYGYDNWYDWCCSNWDTKWDTYDVGDWSGDHINFNTAWTPPLPVIKVLSEKFPEVTIKIQYADEGCGWVGYTVFKAGKVIDKEEYCDYKSKEFREMYFDITGTDLDDVDAEYEEMNKE